MPDCVKAADSWQRFGNKKSDSPGKVENWNNHKNLCKMTEAELFSSKGAEMSGNKLKNRSKAPVFRDFRLSERPCDNDLISSTIGRIIFCASHGLQV